MFGQRASSQIVCSESPCTSFWTSKYEPSFDGARTFIHSGRRGRSATGSEVSIAASLRTGRSVRTGQVRSFRLIVLAGAVAATVAAAAWGGPSRVRFTFDAPGSGFAVDRGSLWVSIAGDDLVLRLDLRTGRRLARIVLPRAD